MLRRIASMVAACLALTVVSGCTLAAQVRPLAEADFDCPASKITTEDIPAGVRATGCGRSAIYNGFGESPIKRASYDLACSPEKLEMVDLDDRGIGVSGCGKRTTYSWVGHAWVQGAVTTEH